MALRDRVRALRGWLAASAAFLRARPASLAGVLGAAVFGAALGVPTGQTTFTYLWADDRFCNDCHVHDYANENFDRSVHQGVTTCHDCHLVPLSHYPKNLYVTVFATPQVPEDIPRSHVETVVCVRCHSEQAADEALTGPMSPELRPLITKIDHSPGHLRHLGATRRDPAATEDLPRGDETWAERHGQLPDWHAGRIQCVDCHGSRAADAHRFSSTAENCLACHESERPHTDSRMALDCRSCHFAEFVTPEP